MQSARAFTSFWLPCLTLSVLAACSTTYLDVPGRPDATSDATATMAAQPDLPTLDAEPSMTDSARLAGIAPDSSSLAAFSLLSCQSNREPGASPVQAGGVDAVRPRGVLNGAQLVDDPAAP